ncbi:hypothetical protein SNEBB_000675 [Seison nebaliae]|nr:hypothetical protein SNEBB_000675 [Seison nebaliae]
MDETFDVEYREIIKDFLNNRNGMELIEKWRIIRVRDGLLESINFLLTLLLNVADYRIERISLEELQEENYNENLDSIQKHFINNNNGKYYTIEKDEKLRTGLIDFIRQFTSDEWTRLNKELFLRQFLEILIRMSNSSIRPIRHISLYVLFTITTVLLEEIYQSDEMVAGELQNEITDSKDFIRETIFLRILNDRLSDTTIEIRLLCIEYLRIWISMNKKNDEEHDGFVLGILNDKKLLKNFLNNLHWENIEIKSAAADIMLMLSEESSNRKYLRKFYKLYVISLKELCYDKRMKIRNYGIDIINRINYFVRPIRMNRNNLYKNFSYLYKCQSIAYFIYHPILRQVLMEENEKEIRNFLENDFEEDEIDDECDKLPLFDILQILIGNETKFIESSFKREMKELYKIPLSHSKKPNLFYKLIENRENGDVRKQKLISYGFLTKSFLTIENIHKNLLSEFIEEFSSNSNIIYIQSVVELLIGKSIMFLLDWEIYIKLFKEDLSNEKCLILLKIFISAVQCATKQKIFLSSKNQTIFPIQMESHEKCKENIYPFYIVDEKEVNDEIRKKGTDMSEFVQRYLGNLLEDEFVKLFKKISFVDKSFIFFWLLMYVDLNQWKNIQNVKHLLKLLENQFTKSHELSTMQMYIRIIEKISVQFPELTHQIQISLDEFLLTNEEMFNRSLYPFLSSSSTFKKNEIQDKVLIEIINREFNDENTQTSDMFIRSETELKKFRSICHHSTIFRQKSTFFKLFSILKFFKNLKISLPESLSFVDRSPEQILYEIIESLIDIIHSSIKKLLTNFQKLVHESTNKKKLENHLINFEQFFIPLSVTDSAPNKFSYYHRYTSIRKEIHSILFDYFTILKNFIIDEIVGESESIGKNLKKISFEFLLQLFHQIYSIQIESLKRNEGNELADSLILRKKRQTNSSVETFEDMLPLIELKEMGDMELPINYFLETEIFYQEKKKYSFKRFNYLFQLEEEICKDLNSDVIPEFNKQHLLLQYIQEVFYGSLSYEKNLVYIFSFFQEYSSTYRYAFKNILNSLKELSWNHFVYFFTNHLFPKVYRLNIEKIENSSSNDGSDKMEEMTQENYEFVNQMINEFQLKINEYPSQFWLNFHLNGIVFAFTFFKDETILLKNDSITTNVTEGQILSLMSNSIGKSFSQNEESYVKRLTANENSFQNLPFLQYFEILYQFNKFILEPYFLQLIFTINRLLYCCNINIDKIVEHKIEKFSPFLHYYNFLIHTFNNPLALEKINKKLCKQLATAADEAIPTISTVTEENDNVERSRTYSFNSTVSSIEEDQIGRNSSNLKNNKIYESEPIPTQSKETIDNFFNKLNITEIPILYESIMNKTLITGELQNRISTNHNNVSMDSDDEAVDIFQNGRSTTVNMVCDTYEQLNNTDDSVDL